MFSFCEDVPQRANIGEREQKRKCSENYITIYTLFSIAKQMFWANRLLVSAH